MKVQVKKASTTKWYKYFVGEIFDVRPEPLGNVKYKITLTTNNIALIRTQFPDAPKQMIANASILLEDVELLNTYSNKNAVFLLRGSELDVL